MQPQNNDQLLGKKCQACEGGLPAYSTEEARAQLAALGNRWELSDDGKLITRRWKLKNFVEAMSLSNKIAELAEQEQHHPDLHITGYRLLRVDLTTHAIGGLSENDFILAAKIDRLSQP